MVECYERVKKRNTYSYISKNSKNIENNKTKINSLKKTNVPPSYSEVEICYNWKKNTWRATGRDGTGQKQFFYSTDHWEESHKNKLNELLALGHSLSDIDWEIERLLNGRKVAQRLLDALALKIMMICHFRVGHPKNLRNNQTYGVTTLAPKHIKKLRNGKIEICFIGKKQQVNKCQISEPKVVYWIERLLKDSKLTGNDLLLSSEYGHKATPESVNKFLQDFDPNITAKVWRTWFANLYFIDSLKSDRLSDTKSERQREIQEVVNDMSKKLHHSPSINKQSYLIKDLPEIYLNSPKTWEDLSKTNKDGYEFFTNYLEYHCDK
jgi:DNA topoisomerase IB